MDIIIGKLAQSIAEKFTENSILPISLVSGKDGQMFEMKDESV